MEESWLLSAEKFLFTKSRSSVMDESWLLSSKMFLFRRSLFSASADTCPAKLWSEIKKIELIKLSLKKKALNH